MSSNLSHGRLRRVCAAALVSFVLFAASACGSNAASSESGTSASSDEAFPVTTNHA